MLKLAVLAVTLCSALSRSTLQEDVDADGRIIGGQTASQAQFPHQAFMRLTGSNRFACGASILSQYWILTAAHCVERTPHPSQFVIVVGTNDHTSGGETHRVSQVIPHRGYDTQKIANDIALIRLATPITFNNRVQPIKLADHDVSEGTSCVISGWGRYTIQTNDLSVQLQFLPMRSVSLRRCQQELSGVVPLPVSTSNFCAFQAHGRGMCHGDSGGPLVCNGVQHGIASWVHPCARGKPDVFVKVAFYRNWIKTNSGI